MIIKQGEKGVMVIKVKMGERGGIRRSLAEEGASKQ